MRFLILSILLGLAVVGCTGPASATDVSVSDSSAGRKIYVTKCAKCHKLYNPAKYSDEDWAKWMGKMSKKAKLKPEQEELLSQYIYDTLRTPHKLNREKSESIR